MQPAFLDEGLHRGARASVLCDQRRERSIHDQGIASGRIRDRSLAREVRREDREDQSGREGRYEGRFYVRRFCSLPAGIVEDSTGFGASVAWERAHPCAPDLDQSSLAEVRRAGMRALPGDNVMSRLLAVAVWLTAIITVGPFVGPGCRLPESVSAHSPAIDHQFRITLAVIGIGFAITHAALGYAVWRYRAKDGERASYSHGDARVEIILAACVGVIFIALAIAGQRVWAQLRLNQAPPDAVQIEAVAQQFVWNFRYPGADGKFGRTEPKLYNDSDNSIGARPGPLGIDPNDPAGKDDVVMTTMVAPVNRPINLTLRSKDVIHDFYVPALRLKQDAVPGMKINIHFTATREGRYEIACAELCGMFHHQMRAYLDVKSSRDYEEWLKKNSK